MTLRKHLADGLKPVVDLIYPPRCPLCGDALAEQSGLCAACWGELEVPGEPACLKCMQPLGTGKVGSDSICSFCELDPPDHSGIAAATIYNDASRQLILAFKHGGKIALAALMGRLMSNRLVSCNDGVLPPLLIPVPLHRWRLWQRGFNQAALLARELERHGKGALMVDALVRRKRTPSLGGLGNEARRRALQDAIVVRRSRANSLAGRDVILVDDVLTSGATSNACVKVLREAGAASVQIVCFARVMMGGTVTIPQNTTPEAVTTPGAT